MSASFPTFTSPFTMRAESNASASLLSASEPVFTRSSSSIDTSATACSDTATSQLIPLSKLQPGEIGQIVRFSAELKLQPNYRQKLLSMGLTPQTLCLVVRKAPLGDPIQIKVRNFDLSLRKHEACHVLVIKQASPADSLVSTAKVSG